MWNINPLEIMWKYITFQWSWNDFPKRDLMKGFILYPIKAPICLFILIFCIVQYYVGGLRDLFSRRR